MNFNRIFGGHYGIYLRDGGRNYSIIGNEVYGTSDNAIITTSANTYPNNWRSDMQMIGNKIFKCAQAAFAIGRINGGSFAFNSIDSCSDDFILNYNVYIDSLIGVIASGNTVSPAGYGSGKRVNIGAYAQRLPLSNPKSLPGLQYIATDNDSNFTYMWQGGAYVKMGSGGVGLSQSQVSGIVHDSLSVVTFAKNASRDSVIINIGGHRYAVKDSVGSAGMTNPMTTSQDIIVGGSSGTPTRLAKGTDGQVLKMVSGNVAWSNSSTADGQYVTDTEYELPSLSSVAQDTAIYSVINDKVHVAGTLKVTIAPGGGSQTLAISLPPSYNSQFPLSSTNWAWGTAFVIKVSDGTMQTVPIKPFFFAGTGGLSVTFTGVGNAQYEIRFDAFYKDYSGE